MEVKSEAEILAEISGRSQVQRLRDWEEGSTLYGVSVFSEGYTASMGKTFPETDMHGNDGKEQAEAHFKKMESMSKPTSDRVLFKATVTNVQTEPMNPNDPGEPPLKFGDLSNVEILRREPPEPAEKD